MNNHFSVGKAFRSVKDWRNGADWCILSLSEFRNLLCRFEAKEGNKQASRILKSLLVLV